MDFRDIKEFFKDIFGYILIAVVVILVMHYVITLNQNVGPSMTPSLNNGDVIFVNKLIYKIREPKRNEIVAFLYTDAKYLVKRVIGLPGERIDYKDNILYINNEPYAENFLGDDVVTDDFQMEQITGCEDGIIPENMYLVLGDNRSDSTDSIDFGVIKDEDLIGKLSLRIWPFSNIGFVK